MNSSPIASFPPSLLLPRNDCWFVSRRSDGVYTYVSLLLSERHNVPFQARVILVFCKHTRKGRKQMTTWMPGPTLVGHLEGRNFACTLNFVSFGHMSCCIAMPLKSPAC